MVSVAKILAQGAQLNPRFTKYAIGVAVVLAVLAIAKSYFGDDWFTIIYGSALVFVGMLIVAVISQLRAIPGLEVTIMWFVRVLLLGLTVLLFTAVSYAVSGFPSTFPCTARFNAGGCSRLVANPPAPPAVPAAAPPPAAEDPAIRKQYTVYVQFAGFMRPTIIDGTTVLRQLGWQVPGEERIGTAAGLREIRYRAAEDKPAADLLAADLGKTKLPAVKVRQVGIITRGTLELWISQ